VRYGVEVVTLGRYADPRRVVELGVAAEEGGFEMLAVWDHLAFAWGVPLTDPLVTLGGVAQATSGHHQLEFTSTRDGRSCRSRVQSRRLIDRPPAPP